VSRRRQDHKDHKDHKDWVPSAMGCLLALAGLLIGATLDWLQRDHRR